MKTKTQNQISELKSRPEQLSTAEQAGTEQPITNTASAAAPVRTREPLPPLDYVKRRKNRQLPTEAVVSLLRTNAPDFFPLAEVVGKWVWIQFADKQPPTVTRLLAELGFHWNGKRQTWQHPCGQLSVGSPKDPRELYGSYFPAAC